MSRYGGGGTFPYLFTLDELVQLLAGMPGLFVRHSRDPESDRGRPNVDRESGLVLPGLPVQQLYPEPWWTLPLHDWVARQLWHSLCLSDDGTSHHGWILLGQVVGKGPDSEPLVTYVEPVARLGDELATEAFEWYRVRFERSSVLKTPLRSTLVD